MPSDLSPSSTVAPAGLLSRVSIAVRGPVAHPAMAADKEASRARRTIFFIDISLGYQTKLHFSLLRRAGGGDVGGMKRHGVGAVADHAGDFVQVAGDLLFADQ